MALNALENTTFEITMQRAVPLFLPLAVQTCIIDGLPPFSLALLLQSPCALLGRSRCRDQHGAWAADLQAVSSCSFSCTLPSTNRAHSILTQKLKRTCRQSFSSSSLFSVTNFLFNMLPISRVRNAELCLAEFTTGTQVFHPRPPPPCLSNRFMQCYVSCLCTSNNCCHNFHLSGVNCLIPVDFPLAFLGLGFFFSFDEVVSIKCQLLLAQFSLTYSKITKRKICQYYLFQTCLKFLNHIYTGHKMSPLKDCSLLKMIER